MKLLGLIGGMSWESTAEYYRLLNQSTRRLLGENHSARLLIYSFDFAEIEALQHDGSWRDLSGLMVEAGKALEAAGAELLILCTNTMHAVFDALQTEMAVPLLHIADATGEAIAGVRTKKVGLLGTRFTMEGDFYRTRLAKKYGLEILTPPEDDREIVHRIIYDELCSGVIDPRSRAKYVRIIEDLGSRGAEGVILGCTEIPLLVSEKDVSLPLFDTTNLHVEAALAACLDTGELPA